MTFPSSSDTFTFGCLLPAPCPLSPPLLPWDLWWVLGAWAVVPILLVTCQPDRRDRSGGVRGFLLPPLHLRPGFQK
jgi:hypothetical protein